MDATNNTEETTWSELLGQSNWQNLLDPLDLNLRKLILRCGDFCQATYDAFNNDQTSKYCGTSRYGKSRIFDKVMLQDAHNYQVFSFLYATARVSVPEAFLVHSLSRESWDRESNWIGYIAVTSNEQTKVLGRREVYIPIRGTTRNYEWINVFGAKLMSAEPLLRGSTTSYNELREKNGSSSDSDDDDSVPKVMHGWLTIYMSDNQNSPFSKTNMRTQLLTKINELREKYKEDNLSIIFTGHSLGASLSVVAAFDVVENGVNDIPVSAIIFGSPQVGNKAFDDRLKSHGNLKILHVVNKIDVIPHYPGRLLGYVYSGSEFKIDTRKSPYLKDSKNPSDWHNLQAMLHVVAGWNGEKGEFELKVKRSVGLVNKSCGFLKEECSVPESWWVEKNKGMIIDDNGEWALASPDEEDLPVPEVFI